MHYLKEYFNHLESNENNKDHLNHHSSVDYEHDEDMMVSFKSLKTTVFGKKEEENQT